MTTADYNIKFLISKNVKNVFLMTGGSVSFIVDAFSRNKNIKYTCVAHEQSAAMMADAYSRCSKGFGATMVTFGPAKKVLKSKKPEFINAIIDSKKKIIPKLEFGKPTEDLSQLLTRTEFNKNMLIP